MSRCLAVVLLLALTGCQTVETYQAYVPPDSITDPAAYDRAVTYCQGAARAYPHPLDLGAVGRAAGQGAGDNLAAGAAAGWGPGAVVVAAGALGQASSALIAQLGLSDALQLRVYLGCLHDLAERTHAYLMLDPGRP